MRDFYRNMRYIATGWMYVGLGGVMLSFASLFVWFGVVSIYLMFNSGNEIAPNWMVPIWPFGTLALMSFGMLFAAGGFSIGKILDYFNDGR